MKYEELIKLLKLENKVISVTRINDTKAVDVKKGGCSLRVLKKVFDGENLIFNSDNMSCGGAKAGYGFSDEIPNIPGGFGNFISTGAGEGFPPGEKIKCSIPVAEQMLTKQPKDVMDGNTSILAKPYESNDTPDLVMILANPDQLSALIHLFNFRKADYDNVIMPMVSGCASLFRIPFGELKRENPRAIVGNVDIFSRPHFDKDRFFFIISAKDFENILIDADDSFLFAPIWNGIKKRL